MRARTNSRRIAVRLMAVALAMASCLGLSVSSAQADPAVDINCFVSGQAELDPGLIAVEGRSFNISGRQIFSLCEDLSGNEIISGVLEFSGSGFGDCTNATATITGTITWYDGTSIHPTSEVLFIAGIAPAGQAISATSAIVTDGVFEGDSIGYLVTDVAIDPKRCVTESGLTHFGIEGDVEFSHT